MQQFSALGHALAAQAVIRYLENMIRESRRPWWASDRLSRKSKMDVDVPSVRIAATSADNRTS